jgi:hypothetical protein
MGSQGHVSGKGTTLARKCVLYRLGSTLNLTAIASSTYAWVVGQMSEHARYRKGNFSPAAQGIMDGARTTSESRDSDRGRPLLKEKEASPYF